VLHLGKNNRFDINKVLIFQNKMNDELVQLRETGEDSREDRVSIQRPDLRSGFIKKQKKFTCSLWMPQTRGDWLATATMAGVKFFLFLNFYGFITIL